VNRAFGLHGFHAFPDKVRAAINEAGIKLHQAGSSLDFGDGIRPVIFKLECTDIQAKAGE